MILCVLIRVLIEKEFRKIKCDIHVKTQDLFIFNTKFYKVDGVSF